MEELATGGRACTVQCGRGHARLDVYGSCEACGSGTYSAVPNQKVCTRCPANTQSPAKSEKKSDCSCAPGFYSANRKTGEPCLYCPEGARCRGGKAGPVARPGYTTVGNDAFAACVPAEACARGDDCAEGYTGDRCAACAAGYSRVAGYCQACGARATTGLIGMVAVSLAVCGGLLVSNLRSSVLAHATSLVIGVNALQVVAQFGRLNIAWPYAVQTMLDTMSSANMNVELLAVECIGAGGSAGTSAYYTRFALAMSLPFMLVVVVLTLYAAGRGLSAALAWSSPTPEEWNRAALQAMVQLVLFLYLPLSATLLEFFDCVPSGEPGVTVLSTAPDVVCGSPTWKRARNAAAIFLCIYPIGVPLVLAGVLFVAKSRLSEMQFGLRFGFLTVRYTEQSFYYELVVILRKLALSLTLTLVTSSAYIQAGATFAILLLIFVVHGVLSPFEYPRHNRLEAAAILLVMSILKLGVMAQDGGFGDVTRSSFVVLVILCLVCVIALSASYDIVLLRSDARSLLGADTSATSGSTKDLWSGSVDVVNMGTWDINADDDEDEPLPALPFELGDDGSVDNPAFAATQRGGSGAGARVGYDGVNGGASGAGGASGGESDIATTRGGMGGQRVGYGVGVRGEEMDGGDAFATTRGGGGIAGASGGGSGRGSGGSSGADELVTRYGGDAVPPRVDYSDAFTAEGMATMRGSDVVRVPPGRPEDAGADALATTRNGWEGIAGTGSAASDAFATTRGGVPGGVAGSDAGPDPFATTRGDVPSDTLATTHSGGGAVGVGGEAAQETAMTADALATLRGSNGIDRRGYPDGAIVGTQTASDPNATVSVEYVDSLSTVEVGRELEPSSALDAIDTIERPDAE